MFEFYKIIQTNIAWFLSLSLAKAKLVELGERIILKIGLL